MTTRFVCSGWFKSSHSDGNGNCVEVAWFTSSHSDGNGQCVEVAFAADRVGARDSKNVGGPELAFAGPAWSAFITGLRTGHRTP